jgi:hypothetical protein
MLSIKKESYNLNKCCKVSSLHHSILILSAFCCQSLFIYSQPATPKFEFFQPVNTDNAIIGYNTFMPFYQNPILAGNSQIEKQNLRILQQSGIISLPGRDNSPQKQLAQLNEELKTDIIKAKEYRRNAWQKAYENSLQQLLKFNPDSFSITRAVYLTERAYYDKPFTYEEFEGAVKEWASLTKQILQKEGLNETNNTAVNYAIQKLFSRPNTYYDSIKKKSYPFPQLRYDFDDPFGDKDWRKMFVTKLLETGTGQCHSLPLLYLCIAEQLNTKAYLSLSPNHSFIQYFDQQGNRYSFETTNGNLVSQSWLMQCNYINATALKNKFYLDTLSSRKLYAQCLSDLLLGHLMKIGCNKLSDKIMQKIQAIDTVNIVALMTQANMSTSLYREKANAAGNPPLRDFKHYPALNAAYNVMNVLRQKVDQTGYTQMPIEEYKKWLISFGQAEKQKEQNRREQERMRQEIEKLKKIKSTFTNKPKN